MWEPNNNFCHQKNVYQCSLAPFYGPHLPVTNKINSLLL